MVYDFQGLPQQSLYASNDFLVSPIKMHLFIHDILAARDIEKSKIYDVVKVAKMMKHSH